MLAKITETEWETATPEIKSAIAPMGAAAVWGIGHWAEMKEYIKFIKNDTHDSAFFQAILCIHCNLFPQAMSFIDKTRELLGIELSALANESYARAYNVVVRIQMLSELEEIIKYKQLYHDPDAQANIRAIWDLRIKSCQKSVDVWQRILKVRALVLSPKEDEDVWIKFSNLCRNSGRLGLSKKNLNVLLECPSDNFDKLVSLDYIACHRNEIDSIFFCGIRIFGRINQMLFMDA